MTKQKLHPEFDWQRWTGEESDLTSLGRLKPARMLFDMLLIREFEEGVLSLLRDGCVWGPVHSSIGQEAVAAGVIGALEKQDAIVGSHRAHHQFLSKVLNSVLDEAWDPRRDDVPHEADEAVMKTLAEIMGPRMGYCGGRGGSMHLRSPEAGVLGTNAIVGGGIPLATGAAFARKYRRNSAIVVCFFGDGAANQGSFHESCNLAGLWNLPIIYVIENNSYAVATHVRDSCAVETLSLRAASYSMTARIVEGHDVAALYAATQEAAEDLRNGGKPSIIEVMCYRHLHHGGDQPGSAYGYRDKQEEQLQLAKDAATRFPPLLITAGLIGEKDVERIRSTARECVRRAIRHCTIGSSPAKVRDDLWPEAGTASSHVRSNQMELASLPYQERSSVSSVKTVSYVKAISMVTGRWLEKDERVFVLGEEVANLGGGAYGATRGLLEEYAERIYGTPISECGFVGLAFGAAASGLRPIVELMFPDFSLVAADQLFNQIGKARHMFGGTVDLPLVVRTRIAIGCGYGGQHSMDPVGLFSLFPGWRIVAPGNAYDYIGLFNTAMHSLDPVLIMEHHSLYGQESEVPSDSVDYCLPLGQACVVEGGRDITVVAYGAMVGRLMALTPELRDQGVSPEIIDLRTVDSLGIDYHTIGESVRKTGAVVVVEEAPPSQGIAARIEAQITERFFDDLDGPPAVINSLDVPPSVSRVLEAAVILGDKEISQDIREIAQRRRR